MPIDNDARVRTLNDIPAPLIAPTAFIAAGAIIVGNVSIQDRASVWYNAVLRAEAAPITIGTESNMQDSVVCHVDKGFPLTIGSGVSVGHNAVLHGCTIGDNSLIGMGATVLNGAVIGEGCLVAAGTVVLEGTDVPSGSLIAGVPGKVRRQLTQAERAGIRNNAYAYLQHVAEHTAD